MLPSVIMKSWRVVADVLKLDLRFFYFLAEVGGLEVALKIQTSFFKHFFFLDDQILIEYFQV